MEQPRPTIRRTVASTSPGGRYLDPAQPSRLLMQAVLEDGIRTFLAAAATPTTRGRRIWMEELRWLTGTDRSDPFTFESICEALSIDAPSLRRRILAAGSRAPIAEPQSRTAPRGTMP